MRARGEAITIRALSEHDGPFSLGLVYSAVHRTPEWKQEHLFTDFSELMQFVQATLQAGEKGGGAVGKAEERNGGIR